MNHPIMYRLFQENVAHFVDHPREVPEGLEWFIVPAKVIPYIKPEGTIAIVHPCLNEQMPWETFDDFLLRLIDKDVPSGCKYTVVNHVDIPHSRRLRNAWRLDWPHGGVFVDQEEARKVLVENALAESVYWLSQLDPMMRRMKHLDWFGDALFNLPEVVGGEVANLTVEEMTDYPVPIPELPEELDARLSPKLREYWQQTQRALHHAVSFEHPVEVRQ